MEEIKVFFNLDNLNVGNRDMDPSSLLNNPLKNLMKLIKEACPEYQTSTLKWN